MENVNVLIYVESRYKLNRKKVKSAIYSVCEQNKITTHVEVSVAVVGDRKMKSLNKKYRNKDGTANILTFPLSEGGATPSISGKEKLGDIVISYPQVIRDASREEMLVDERIEQLVIHGMNHLLGLHHE